VAGLAQRGNGVGHIN